MHHSSNQHRQNTTTIAKRRRFDKINQEIETWKQSSKIKTEPSAVIGKSPRNSQEKKEGPGPGAYDLYKMPFQDKQMVSFKGNRLVRCQTDSPGPGSYQSPSSFSSQKFSFPKSKINILNQIRPDPTTYNIPSSEKPRGISFPKKKRDSINEKSKEFIPGPGNYQWKEEKLTKNKYSFSKSKKFSEEEKELCQKEGVPGPGNYQSKNPRNKMPSYKFSQALKNFVNKEITPGPGSYTCQMTSMVHNGGSLSREKRNFEYGNNIPGPGNYKQVPVSSIKNREPIVKFSRSHTQHAIKKSEIGPGAYYKNKIWKIKGGVIGREKRGSIQTSAAPGPLSYVPHFEEVLTRSAHICFGKEERSKDSISRTPGPGYYNIERKSHSLASSQVRQNMTQMRRPPQDERLQNNTSLDRY